MWNRRARPAARCTPLRLVQPQVHAVRAPLHDRPELLGQLSYDLLTVKKHLEHIYRKLGVESRTEGLARVLELVEITQR